MKPQFLISAATTGCGKTLFALGIIRALKKRGWRVQPFKHGADFMDAQLLSISADEEAVHLDTWLASHTHIQHLYNKYGDKADVCITESSSALMDGYKKTNGSGLEMSQLLDIPVILLVNARLCGYSIAPLIYGFKNFHPHTSIMGVVFNQVSSEGHFKYLREACTDAGVDCLGYLPIMENIKLPGKHTGLTLTERRNLDYLINELSDVIEKQIDINKIINSSNRGFPCKYTLPYTSDIESDHIPHTGKKINIAIARDAAFSFTFRENIDQLKKIGKVIYFSPVYGSDLPDADLIYLPNGFPELFARQLHRRRKFMDDLKTYIENGGKVLAEGGGTYILGNSLTAKSGGTAYQMCGIIPRDFCTSSAKLQTGYKKIKTDKHVYKGYDYNFLSFTQNIDIQPSITRYKNLIACNKSIYWGENDILQLWNEIT